MRGNLVVPQHLLVLLPQLLLLLLELGLLLNQLAHALLQPAEGRLGEDQGVLQVGGQFALGQVLDLVHLERDNEDDLCARSGGERDGVRERACQ